MVRHAHIRKAVAAFAATALFFAVAFLDAAPARAETLKGRNAIGSVEDAALIATLIRSNLIGLHLAMMSGNFSVMRDLAAPSFRDRNTNAHLAQIFEPIRQRGINLEAVAVLQPDLEAAVIDENGLLRMAGIFQTRPSAVRFELAFQVVNQSWALFGVRVVPLEALAETRSIGQASVPVPTPRPNQ